MNCEKSVMSFMTSFRGVWIVGFFAMMVVAGMSHAQDSVYTPLNYSERLETGSINPAMITAYFRVENNENYIDELRQNLTVSFENETVKTALKEIAAQANLGLAYSSEWRSMNEQISFTMVDGTVAEGLKRVLADTEYEAAITRRREIVLVKRLVRQPVMEPVSTAQQGQQEGFGTIIGEITDAESGEALPGAQVIIQGTTIGAATDVDGRYLIRRVSSGDHVVVIQFMGYETEEVEVTIRDGERTTVSRSLQITALMGDEISILARQRGQARALTRQRQSVNIRNIISEEQIDAFGDNTVEGALSRISGMGHGGANIRGVGSGAAVVTMDGQRMGATGNDRSVNINNISADMVQELDVIKVITPDMDADALSGVINISTRRPIGGEKNMNIRVGGGFQDRYMKYAGTEQRAAFSYGDSPSDNFSFGFNFSYQRDPGSRESFNTTWASPRAFNLVDPEDYTESQRALLPDHIFKDGTGDDESRVSDYIQRLSNTLRFNVPVRIGTGLQMTFQPTDITTFHVQGMFNVRNQETSSWTMSYEPEMAAYQSPVHTGNPVRRVQNPGHISYRPRLDESVTHQYTIQVGARHLLDNMDMEYAVGWGHGRNNSNQHRISFQTSIDHDFIFNFDDREEPTVNIAPWSPRTVLQPSELRLLRSGGLDHFIGTSTNNDFKGSLDFTTPFSLGEIKFGSSASLAFIEGNSERLYRDYRSPRTLSDFAHMGNASWNTFGREHATYEIPWLIDLAKWRQFYYNQVPNFSTHERRWALEVETSDYSGGEHTFAGYAMSNTRFGWFSLLGGLRVEHTISLYTGRDATLDIDGAFIGAIDRKVRNDYTNLFPNLQSVIHLGDMTNIRLAFSRSIGRPNFNQLNPHVLRDYRFERVTQGNPELNPMLSNNFDILVEHYFWNVGQISVGLFYKDMKDFVFRATRFLPMTDEEGVELEFGGWEETTFHNGDEATVYGIEFSWQQNYDFLPGFLGNFGTYFNYSLAQSIAQLDRDFKENHTHVLADLFEFLGRDVDDDDKYITPLSGQRPHVFNAGLDYNHGGFSSQLSYQWGAPSISSFGSRQILPPEHRPDPSTSTVYVDGYRDAANNLSLTMRYRITSQFQVWTNASNMLNHRSIDYRYKREIYPTTSALQGRKITMGLRYQL